MKDVTISVEAGGKPYTVVFAFEWHNPPLDGEVTHLPRIKQTTTCTINGKYAGKRQCSVVDRYNHMKGVRESLEQALHRLRLTTFDGSHEINAEIRRQVMPAAAAEYQDYLNSRKRSRPGVRAYRRLALQADADLEAIRLITSIGVEAFVDQKIAERKFAQDAVKL